MLKVSRLSRARPSELLGFIRAYFWLFRAKRLMKHARGSQWLSTDRFGETNPGIRDDMSPKVLGQIKKRVAAISRASRYPVTWAYCLQQSFALRNWLAEDGIVTEVRYGVRKRGELIDAHAWVVYNGKIINDSVMHISTFAPLKSMDEFGTDSKGSIRNALVTSRTSSEKAGEIG